jgi:Methylenetetrahydrofolate reductase
LIPSNTILSGDPPKGSSKWEPTPGGLEYAIDLVKLIKKEYGDFFCVAAAGFPEGHPSDKEHLVEIFEPSGLPCEDSIGFKSDTLSLKYLKEKV